MSYPPRPTRQTNFRQAESAGLGINTGNLDAEFNQLQSVVDQIVTRLVAVTTSDGRLKDSAALTTLALAGAQRFVATAGQTQFNTSIVWDSAMTALATPVLVNGVARDPSTVTVANNSGNLRVTLGTGAALNDVVVIRAYTAGAGVVARLADGSDPANAANMVTVQDTEALFSATTVEGCLRELRLIIEQFFSAFNVPTGSEDFTATASQTVFDTALAWDASLSARNVFVYQSGVLLAPAEYSVANNGGFVRVTLVTGALVGELVTVRTYSLASLWTAAGVTLSGSAATADFNLGSNKITNLAAGSALTDAVNVQQLQAYGAGLSDLLSIFIRKDGSLAFTANQSMGTHKLTDLAAPTNANDASRKTDVDAGDALNLALAGTKTSVPKGTLTGPVTLGKTAADVADADQTTSPATVTNHTIHGVPTPSADAQVANKSYVDNTSAINALKVDQIFYDSPTAGNWTATGSGAGNWTVPAGVTKIAVEGVGGGGGGGGGGEDSVGSNGATGGDTTVNDGTARTIGKGGGGGGGATFGPTTQGIGAVVSADVDTAIAGKDGVAGAGGEREMDFSFAAGGIAPVGDVGGDGAADFGTGGGGGGSDGTGGVGSAAGQGKGGGGGSASWGRKVLTVTPGQVIAIQIGKGGDGGNCGTGGGAGAGATHRAGTDGTVPVGNDGGGGGGGGAGMLRIWYKA